MKTASVAVLKWQNRTSTASDLYEEGAKTTDKDQAAAAIAALPIAKQALLDAFARNAQQKGLIKSGKEGWLTGVVEKGKANFITGVMAKRSASKYVENSSKYDEARKAADKLPRGPKGSPANLLRVGAVANALRAVKIAK